MSRMNMLRQRLALLPDTPRRIIYLITEDRNFLEELFAAEAAVLKTLSDPVFADKTSLEDRNMYRACVENGYLVDIYEKRDPDTGEMHFNSAVSNPWKKTPFYYLSDFHLLSPEQQAKLVKAFLYVSREREQEDQPAYLFLLSPIRSVPIGFEQEIEILDVPEMDLEDTHALLKRLAQEHGPLDEKEQERIWEAARDMKGIPRWEVLDIVRQMGGRGSFFGRTDQTMEKITEIEKRRSSLIREQKQRSASRDSTITLQETSDSVAGMEDLMRWLDRIRRYLRHPEEAQIMGARIPRGVLLNGIPGCGKTEAAKTFAEKMGVPLVELRMENLLGSYVGDSETNFKRYRKQVEALAPCVVLIDEIQRMFSEDGNDSNGVRSNLLTALLNWMQEKDKQIFFFATCNTVKTIPPALLRPGRFARKYCTFMPTRSDLEQIMVFHLEAANKRSGGRLMGKFEGETQLVVQDFMQWMEEQIRGGRDMFHTGASLENLINETSLYLLECAGKQDGQEDPYPDRDTYLEALKTVSSRDDAQAFGESDMPTIVRFWIGALENKYVSASSNMQIPFAAFDKEKGKFIPDKLTKYADDGYDRLLQQRITGYIEEYWHK